MLVVGDPTLIASLAGHPDLDAGRGIAALSRVMGDGSLITLDREAHAQRRHLVAPLFARDLATADHATRDAATAVCDQLAAGTHMTGYELARRITLRAIVSHLLAPPDRTAANRVEELTASFLGSFASPWLLFLRPLQIDLGPLTAWGRARRRRRRLEQHLHQLLAAARTTPETAGGLGRLLLAGGSALADDDVVSELVALLLFGHDTAAATLAWAFAHLWADAAVVARIRAEADALAATGNTEPEAHLFLAACLRESLRLAPVVVHLTRVARRAVVVGPHLVPAGGRIFIAGWLAQRDPAAWPEPERFLPARHLTADGSALLRPADGAYLPFGIRPRTCVGQPFAWRQMLILLSTLVRRLDVALLSAQPPRPRRQLVLMLPADGTPLVVGPRQGASA